MYTPINQSTVVSDANCALQCLQSTIRCLTFRLALPVCTLYAQHIDVTDQHQILWNSAGISLYSLKGKLYSKTILIFVVRSLDT